MHSIGPTHIDLPTKLIYQLHIPWIAYDSNRQSNVQQIKLAPVTINMIAQIVYTHIDLPTILIHQLRIPSIPYDSNRHSKEPHLKLAPAIDNHLHL